MKILHTADWHIGKKLDHYSRLEEQREVLAEICVIADENQVDAVVVAGDLFDNFSPSSEATELLYKTLHQLTANGTRAVIAIAGNHDSPDRIEVPDILAKMCGIIFIGFPNTVVTPFETPGGIKVTKTDHGFFELALPFQHFPLRIIHTAYANEQRLKTFLGVENSEDGLRDHLQLHWKNLATQYLDADGFNLLVTHLYVMKKGEPMLEEPDDERSILHIGGAQAIYTENFPEEVNYVALGHLHRYHTVSKKPSPSVYSSSPLAYSFSEENQTKYVVILEADKNQLLRYDRVELKKGKRLKRKKFDNIDIAVQWLEENQDDLVELTIESDQYLEATDKRRLLEVHQGIIQIIPQIRNSKSTEFQNTIDLSLSVENLFQEYFKSKNKGQEPSEGLMNVLKEVLSTRDTIN